MDWSQPRKYKPEHACPFKPGDLMRFKAGAAVGCYTRCAYGVFKFLYLENDGKRAILEDRGHLAPYWWRLEPATKEDTILAALIVG